jgi:leucyl/phenylalanyl-tRNA--protein transferase
MPSRYFPPAQRASPEGLVAVGGRLSPNWLLDAYRHGIFPWPSNSYEPMLWWSPDPRAILPLDGMHISRRLERRLRSGEFETTCNQAFGAVIAACASGPGREGGTWITPEMIAAYTELHRLGHAHSVEVWREGVLTGGVYGVAISGLFAAESMFHRARDGSKVALARLVHHLQSRGFTLLDVQQATPHTESLGVVEISRREYLERLAIAVELDAAFGDEITPWASA